MIRRKHVKLPRNALAASLASSDDQVVIVMIFSFGIQFSYMLAKAFMAATPSVVYKLKIHSKSNTYSERQIIYYGGVNRAYGSYYLISAN